MEDGDGVRLSSCSDIENKPSTLVEEDDPTKPASVRDSTYSSNNHSEPIKLFLGFNSVNGDCAEKDISQFDSSLVGSSSNNSFSSESSETTHDSSQDDTTRVEADSSSDNSSKSSNSNSSHKRLQESISSPKSPLVQGITPLSESSDDSDSSDSEDTIDRESNNEATQLGENPEAISLQSAHDLIEKEENKIVGSSTENENFKTNICPDSSSLLPDKDINVFIGPVLSQPSSEGLPKDSEGSHDEKKAELPSFKNTLNSDTPICESDPPMMGSLDDLESIKVPSEKESEKPIENDQTAQSEKVIPEPEQSETLSPAASHISTQPDVSALKQGSNEKDIERESISIENNGGKITEGVNSPEQKEDQTDFPKTRSQTSDPLPKLDCVDKTVTKPSEKINKNSRRKTEDKNLPASDNYNPADKFPIQYKGFKINGKNLKSTNYNKSLLRWNPFNPCRKKDIKTGKYILQKSYRDDVDCSTLQPEYAQYLGLQPLLKFKCYHCGTSTFSTLSALNSHHIECKKNAKNNSQVPVNVPIPEVNSTNIKFTRKVFLCTTCGTYYENCDLFLHMREYHRRYICLFCLYMGLSPDSLLEHLKEKHKVVNQVCSTLEELLKTAPPTFFLLCMTCDRVFTEMDDSRNHKCSPKNSRENEHSQYKRLRTDDAYQVSSHEPSCHLTGDISKIKTFRFNKDISMKPLNNTLNSSEICPFQNSIESYNKTANLPQLINDNKGTNSFESTFINSSLENSEVNPVSQTENLQIKIPSGIEIKPLIPGESSNQENKCEPTNGSSIEIFPINTEPQKPSKKVRTIIRRTIKKKKPLARGKARLLNKLDNSIAPIAEENECLEDNFIPPISPPIIAPPPIVAHSHPAPPSPVGPEPAESGPELAEPEPQTQPEPPAYPEMEQEQHPIEKHAALSPSSTMDESSESPIHPEPEEPQQNTPESYDLPEMKRSLSQDIFKIKLKAETESDAESDDSQKLSLIVDENTNNSDVSKKDGPSEEQEQLERQEHSTTMGSENSSSDNNTNEIPIAREDIAAMALTLDDKIENVAIQAVVKECVRTSCLSCNYCRHAVKIAVNGKQLALHLLSEHRYTPVKNETNEDVVRKLKNSLDTLNSMYFNTETYDSSDPSLHIPYDKESNFDCFQCSYVSSSHKDLYAHKKKCHTKSLLLCIMCKKNFFSYSELICHICSGTYNAESQVYSVDINFRCCFCRLDTIPSAFRLMVHLRKSHHTCDICLEMCSDQQKLSTHMWKHKLSHLCYRCGIAYASKPDITKHLFWKHGTESVLCKKCLQKKWPHVYHFCIPPTSFICEECNTSFSKAVALKVHKRIHGNDYPYSCSQCDKKFVSKKLLARHIDRHNAVFQKKDSPQNSAEDNKEEIINVTDIVDCKEASQNDSIKEDGKDKSHKKHKKEKDKKEKKVVDVYDLPPLNLSSESDSSDEEPTKKNSLKASDENSSLTSSKDNFLMSEKPKGSDMPKLEGIIDSDSYTDKPVESNSFLNILKSDFLQKDGSDDECDRKPTASEPVSPFDSSVVNSLLPLGKDEIKPDITDSAQNEQVEGIWENFYKTNPQNSNLPFPLCAMKSDLAYRIIMGDHDYCNKIEPVIKEDLPSTSNLETNLSDDKLEEVTPLISEINQTPPLSKEEENPSTPPSISKKKVKSPKKKLLKTPDDNNSSSSSDSSSDSDSSCSCGTNCSCCSSSSSSSSSSSDSDSSTNEDKKSDKRKKKKEKRTLHKSDGETETRKEIHQSEPEVVPLPEPEDPPIRESELETDESTSDEEFYDRQPQIIANQMLAEKRQMMQVASGVVSEATPAIVPLPQTPPRPPSPLPPPPPPPPVPQSQENIPPADIIESPKSKPRTKRKRRVNTPKTPKIEKPLMDSNFPKFTTDSKTSPFSLFQQTPPVAKQKPTLPVPQSPSLPEASGSGSETDSTRLSKRRRVPNKFYGYSSGDEEEKQVPKWRKTDMNLTPNQLPKMPTIAPPPTPRIQLTVPKQIIRKPYHKQPSKTKVHSSTESSDSGTSDVDDKVSKPPVQQTEQVKADKDVYCYCRCPYDEVSEMIACDDVNCKIEWFHFECVGILVPPRGQWFCPGCRKARGLPT